MSGLPPPGIGHVTSTFRVAKSSTDTLPYAVEREVEDIEALIDAAGGSACVFGHSSGAVLALEAAARLPAKVKKQVLFEPPFVVDDSRPRVPADFVAQQIDSVFSDLPVRAVKIGMLSQPDVIAAVAEGLDRHGATRIVVDPVMVATSGDRLLAPAAVDNLRSLLAVELLAAVRGLQLRRPLKPSPAGQAAMALVGKVAGEPGPDVFLAPVLEACRDLVAGPDLRAAIEEAAGDLQ